jgi:hypothetical protein
MSEYQQRLGVNHDHEERLVSLRKMHTYLSDGKEAVGQRFASL